MAGIFQTSTSSTVTLNSGDDLFVGEFTQVGVSGADAIQTTSGTVGSIYNTGTIVSMGGDAIDWDHTSGTIFNSGRILAVPNSGKAIELSTNHLQGQMGITNAASGVISGGINLFDLFAGGTASPIARVVISNHGEINNPGHPGSSFQAGMVIDGHTSISLTNTGTISGEAYGAILSARGSSVSIVVNNSGTISGATDTGLAIISNGTTNVSRLINSGTITGSDQFQDVAAVSIKGVSLVHNTATGLIGGALEGDNVVQTVINAGEIIGNVELFDGADSYNGFGGRVTGGIDMGAGDDSVWTDQPDLIIDGGADNDIVYARSDVLSVVNVETIRLLGGGNFEVFASDGAELIQGNLGDNLLSGEGGNDTISGGAGDDAIEGGAGTDHITGDTGDDLINGGSENDTISGGAGSDTILGGSGQDDLNGGAANDSLDGGDNNDTLGGFSGDDTLLGRDGSDLLVGHDGNDSLDGGIAADVLDGGLGNDILLGGEGSDVLRGRAGNDSLDGGQGLDFLTGGPGADSFIFGDAAELSIGANRDQIIDFEQDVDVIDLASLIDGPLGFVGTGPFTAANQVRLIETGSGSTIVQINLDADLGTVEGEIRVANVTGLTADDFAL